jgi:DNA invertase Pin-like site-specific DNA recombinase
VIVDGYVRVSQVAGREGESFISPVTQRADIERWAQRRGAVIGHLFEELDESGGRSNRPLLENAIARVEGGESDGLVVAYLSRFGRSLVDGLAAIKRITDADGAFISVQEGVDFSTDAGRLLLRILLSISEWELDRHRTNWKVAKERAVGRGVFIARTPFGYVRGEDRRLRVDARLAPIVRELFARRADGATYVELRRWLTETEVPAPYGGEVWSDKSVPRMLRQRAYLGEARYLSVVNRAAHPPVVDLETWERAQFNGIRTPVRRFGHHPLLWGLARCSSCQRPLVSTHRFAGPYAGDGHYTCHYNGGPTWCPDPVEISQALLDPYVEQLFWQQVERGGPRYQPRRIAGAEELAERREHELIAYRDNPGLPLRLGNEAFAEGVGVRQQRAETARAKLAQVRSAARAPDLPAAAELRRDWTSMSVAQRRGAIAQVIDCVFVWRGRRGVEERTHVLRHGQSPLGLPNKGEPRLPVLGPFDRKTTPGMRLRSTADWGEDRVHSELAEFLKGRQTWPSFREFQAAGLALLYNQLKRHGGCNYWARRLGVPVVMPGPGGTRWTEARVRAQLAGVLAGRDEWPTSAEFRTMGQATLRLAVIATGGADYWSDQMGVTLAPSQRPKRQWTYESMKAEVARLAGASKRWPRPKEFKAAGLGGLNQLLTRERFREGMAAELGLVALPVRKIRTPSWTADRIRAALDDFLPERQEWPTAQEFKAAGLLGLRTHIWRDGSADRWAREYGLEARHPPRKRPPAPPGGTSRPWGKSTLRPCAP